VPLLGHVKLTSEEELFSISNCDPLIPLDAAQSAAVVVALWTELHEVKMAISCAENPVALYAGTPLIETEILCPEPEQVTVPSADIAAP
jgi:hypothetical protein